MFFALILFSKLCCILVVPKNNARCSSVYMEDPLSCNQLIFWAVMYETRDEGVYNEFLYCKL